MRRAGGFTLVETLLGISLLLVAVMGPFTLAERSIFYASVSQNQIIATYLAQEGIEFARNTRDNNFLQGNDWLEGGGLDGCLPSNGCYVDPIPSGGAPKVTACVGACPPISYRTTGGYYTYSGFDLLTTPFTRTVKLIPLSGDEVKTEVTVGWTERFGARSVVMSENIFNWRK